MLKTLARTALFSLALLPNVAIAEPVRLTPAFFSSDRTTTYLATIKPFVTAVNEEAAGVLRIDVAFSGALGKNPAEQLQRVLEGKADLAFVIPGYTPEHFPDNAVVERPGLFADIREASHFYARLIAANALRGYEELFAVGAFTSEPESIHTRPPVASLDGLRGIRIRANNPVQGGAPGKAGHGAFPDSDQPGIGRDQ